jgi:hypothetical protein
MNVFVLDTDPTLAAVAQCDKHVVKMTLETTLLLTTTQAVYGRPTRYKATHLNHPWRRWAGESRWNYDWLLQHGLALAVEYEYRYGRKHACEDLLLDAVNGLSLVPDGRATAMPLCVPEAYRSPDVVEAYRRLYVAEKSRFARWTQREPPEWFRSAVPNLEGVSDAVPQR